MSATSVALDLRSAGPVSPPADTGSKRRRWIARVPKPLFWITVALLLTFSFVLDLGMVPTASMEGTVLVGDHLLMLKLPYGPHVPFTQLRLPQLRTPQPGEIVAFRSPVEPGEIYLKRVIAGAGDVVALHGGVLYVNGIRSRETYARVRPNRRWTWQENIGPYRVPAGSLFVLGDNRDNSEDSRYWGPIQVASVVGEPLMIFWSYDAPSSEWLDPNWLHQVQLYASALSHVTQVRWRRTGMLLCLK
ncbi:MAG TPA: signal peptidase I [Terriglobales bacterium]|nr:signal peptidase I [Terriglobales bacterium]